MKNRYYIKSIAETIQFLAVNELSFCGSEGHEAISKKAEKEEASPDRGFMVLFLYSIKKDAKSKAIVQIIPFLYISRYAK